MENTCVNTHKDSQGKENRVRKLSKDRELSRDAGLNFSQSISNRLVRRVNSPLAIILSFKQSQMRKNCNQKSLLQRTGCLDSRIPKHMESVDEKHLRRCLELVHMNASKAVRCNASMSLSSLKMGMFPDIFNPTKIRSRDTYDSASFVFQCPLESGDAGVVVSPAGQWIVGTIMGSKSMMNILKSPLFHQFGALDSNANFSNLNDIKSPICYDITDSPRGLSISQKAKKEPPLMGTHKKGSDRVHKRLVSASSTNSTCSDQSSSSASASVSQGMLQCTWKGGLPHFVFSVDDQRQVYLANLWKVESTDDKAMNYMYSFYLGKAGQKDQGVSNNGSHLVGKMKVTASFTLCPEKSKIRETEFVLYGGDESCGIETHTSSLNLRKNKGLSKKMVEVFRMGHSSKQKTFSKCGGSSTVLSLEPSVDPVNNLDALWEARKFESNLLPNFELATIIVKDHHRDSHQEEIGGWGLKFLKNRGSTQMIDSLESSVHCECCARDTGDCSTSMDILIPAGLHGGPRTKNCGPSSLSERWRSGGHCDCGGWDIGCPLTILKTRSSKDEILPEAEMQEECKPYDLFKQGSGHSAPTLRMVNVHDGLYLIHFQQPLSALQSFSIAVAIIHTRSPSLRPKNVRELQ
ncbi:hypothetical protein CJ030_MR3G001182 [Morella rubra]|uniref:Uncharacterized protein n=1 Tax=Morella rubra TaxID=262757 RepID=A0A6A1W2N0_9ROSI|nr:hypothetical protein CJ030_MR3G001182 [Morella rubra]